MNEQPSANIFVIGPHRSGTSAVARLINLCGLHLGDEGDLLPPSADNPRGYWESQWLVQFNDDLLAIFGENWHSAGLLDIDSLPGTIRDELNGRALAWTRLMDRHGPWATKDPRLCLTAPFWLALRPDAPVLFCVRHPASAIASLMHRQGDAIPDRQQAHLIWKRHFMGALLSTANRPKMVIDYDRLLDTPSDELKQINHWLQERLPAYSPPAGLEQSVLAHIDSSLKRHEVPERATDYCDDSDIELYRALVDEDQERIDRLIEGGRTESTSFSLDTLVTQRFELHREVARLTEQLNAARLTASQVEHELTGLERSWAYRAGNLLLSPVRLIRNVLQSREHRGGGGGTAASPSDPDAGDASGEGNQPTGLTEHIFTILMRVGEVEPETLQESIDSVKAQSYQRWELLIEYRPHTGARTEACLDDAAKRDPERIRLVLQTRPSTEVAPGQIAAENAKGTFIVPLDAGDLLDQEALGETVLRLERNPHIDFLYADEDQIAPGVGFTRPFHKPGFSPEYLLSCNYLARFSAIRADRFIEAGGFRVGFEGERDHDLLLRVTKRAETIDQIPRVLYHTRTGGRPGQDWSPQARKILLAAAERPGLKTVVDNGLISGTYRVRFSVDPLNKVTIIIPSSGDLRLLKPCLESIERHTQHPSHEILVVLDGQSGERTQRHLEEGSAGRPWRFIEHPHPFNFSKVNNHAAATCDSSFLLFLNDDVRVLDDGWLTAMLEYAQLPEVGAVGAKLLYPNRTVQHAGIVTGVMGISGHVYRGLPADQAGYFGQAKLIRNCSAVTGACLLIRRELFEAVGGFNEELPITCNDLDLCFKLLEAGKRIVYTPYARLNHCESQTRGRDDTEELRARTHGEVVQMWRIWGERIFRDPYYNPNLTHWKEDCSLSTPWDKRLQADYIHKVIREGSAQA